MSITAVEALSGELRRIAIAGVALARGDRRIAALVPALERSGETVPVLARIAERTKALLEASRADAPELFLQLVTLVGALLRTQGRTGLDGELVPLPPSPVVARPISARVMGALERGLDEGRVEALRGLVERDWFGDVRLAPIALDALRSSHPEIASLAAARMIPPYGRAIVPLLVEALDLAQRRPAARVIEAIARADPDTAATLARQVLDPDTTRVLAIETEGVRVSDEAMAAAVACLGDGDDDRVLLAELLRAKRKAIRTAALRRLLAFGDVDAVAHCLTMLEGSATKVREALESIPDLSDRALADAVLDHARRASDALASEPADRALAAAEAEPLLKILALLVRAEPTSERVAIVSRIVEDVERLWRAASAPEERTLEALIDYLFVVCPERERDTVCRLAMRWDAALAVLVAVRRFGPRAALRLLHGSARDDLLEALEALFPSVPGAASGPAERLPPPGEWSVEWLELGLRHRLAGLVDHLWPLDPALVVKRVLGRWRLDDRAFAVLALTADPGCAAKLARRLAKKGPDYPPFAALCEAIVEGDASRCDALVRELPVHGAADRIETLRSRLAEHLSETST